MKGSLTKPREKHSVPGVASERSQFRLARQRVRDGVLELVLELELELEYQLDVSDMTLSGNMSALRHNRFRRGLIQY